MSECPNCESTNTTPVYKYNDAITYQNVLMKSYDDAIRAPRGNIDLHYCNDCTFLYNVQFDDLKVGYGQEYENDQSYSSAFVKHINAVASKILVDCGMTQHKILEIGCGNGYFLKELIRDDNSNFGVGYDKSLKDSSVNDRISLHNRYYTEAEQGDFDVVLSRHVVEHILNNNFLLKLLKQKNPKATFFIETPSLEWIIRNNTFFDIFYEHCSYFSNYSLSTLIGKHNLNIHSLESAFNGQYLWIAAGNKENTDISLHKNLSLDMIKTFFHSFETMIAQFKNLISQPMKGKKIALWGAGAKGVTFANLIDSQKELIDCVIDINPKKVGKFIPGTGHPIVARDVLLNNEVGMIIIMNSNYYHEIVSEIGNTDIAIHAV